MIHILLCVKTALNRVQHVRRNTDGKHLLRLPADDPAQQTRMSERRGHTQDLRACRPRQYAKRRHGWLVRHLGQLRKAREQIGVCVRLCPLRRSALTTRQPTEVRPVRQGEYGDAGHDASFAVEVSGLVAVGRSAVFVIFLRRKNVGVNERMPLPHTQAETISAIAIMVMTINVNVAPRRGPPSDATPHAPPLPFASPDWTAGVTGTNVR